MSMPQNVAPEELEADHAREFSHATFRVYALLLTGAHTQSELQRKGNMAQRTVRIALDTLRDCGLLIETPTDKAHAQREYRISA